MKDKNKKSIIIILVLFCSSISFLILFFQLPVEIIDVHNDGNYSSVLVKNFPLTDKGKIKWWLKNQDSLKRRYSIPKPASYGSFTIIFWDFSNGYKEDNKYDMFCFEDMNTKKNCIEKKTLFKVTRNKFDEKSILFITYEGRYKLKDNGDIVKVKREE
ncbi:DUF943 family protein [Rouxiella sp. Mn2063]|uniref:DUF943 family protein n=1 Tax=Rouxiella sp. Mn2063 TaxID=3395262 RepID=UPI003BCC0949